MFFQHGNEASSVADLKIADQLYHYMVGGQTKSQVKEILFSLEKIPFTTPNANMAVRQFFCLAKFSAK